MYKESVVSFVFVFVFVFISFQSVGRVGINGKCVRGGYDGIYCGRDIEGRL